MENIKTYIKNKHKKLCINCASKWICKLYGGSCRRYGLWSFVKKVVEKISG